MSERTLLATYRSSITLILWGLNLVNIVKLTGSEYTSMADGVYIMIVTGLFVFLIIIIGKKFSEIRLS